MLTKGFHGSVCAALSFGFLTSAVAAGHAPHGVGITDSKSSPWDMHYYFRGGAGAIFGVNFDDRVDYFVNGARSYNYKVRFEYKPGGEADIAFGVKNSFFRIDVAYGYFTAEPDQLSLYDGNNNLVAFRSAAVHDDAGVGNLNGRYQVVNAYYDFSDPARRYTPYVGIGFGNLQYSIDSNNQTYSSNLADDDGSTLMVQLEVGMAYAISKSFSGLINYRYRRARNMTFNLTGTNSSSQDVRINIAEHLDMQTIGVGFTYSL